MYTELNRERVIEHLKENMRGGKSLIVVDPYFLCKGKKQNIEEYIEELDKVIGEFSKILIFTHTKKFGKDQEIKKEEHKEDEEKIINFLNRNREVKIVKTSKLHDRLWIKDGVDYYIVGSSFNGIGLSFGFIFKFVEASIYEEIKEYLQKKIEKNTNLSKVEKKINLEFIREILNIENKYWWS